MSCHSIKSTSSKHNHIILLPYWSTWIWKSKLGLHAITHYMWQSTNKKNNIILWKLSSIQMKILSDIACNLNSNTLNGIQIWLRWNLCGIKLNWREIICILVKNILKICSWQWYGKKLWKYIFPFLFIGELTKQILVWN